MKNKKIKLNHHKLFFRKDDKEICYPLKSHLKYMVENDLKEMDLFLAKREIIPGFFFCKKYQEVGEKLEGTCGKFCQHYQPRNGKSGICKHHGYTYTPTDISLKVKIVVEY